MWEEYNVKCIIEENEQAGIIQTYENEDEVEVVLKMEDIFIEKRANSFFEALVEIRKELEKRKIKLLCKGCCKNVYPSGMILEMGSGRKAYSLTMGKQAKLNSLVDIFETCQREDYASVEEQYNFFIKWCDSIGGR